MQEKVNVKEGNTEGQLETVGPNINRPKVDLKLGQKHKKSPITSCASGDSKDDGGGLRVAVQNRLNRLGLFRDVREGE